MLRVTVADVVSPSYFPLTAAVELGFFAAEGVAVELVPPPHDDSAALREGAVDLYGGSPYIGLRTFPGWRGGKLLCALSRNAYWMLVVRADLNIARGQIHAVKGLRILAAETPGIALKRLLFDAGIDLHRDKVQIVSPPWRLDPSESWARTGLRAIKEGVADACWGNTLRGEYAVRGGLATVLADVRRGDGPPAAKGYTFPALIATDRFIAQRPAEAAAAVRAVMKAQRALKADPSLATQAARRLFPPEENGMIASLIARDVEYYEPRITQDAVEDAVRFANHVGLLAESVRFDELVPAQFRALWTP
jgi:ABC-type nitrate/sulfonate/bicarbonate transport system substrate-binding protein